MIKCALQYILEIKSNRLKSNQMLVLEERGKPEYPEKNLSEQSREPKNSAHISRRVRESNLGHIGAQPLRHPCSPSIGGSFYKSERPGCYTFLTQTLNGTRIFSCWHGSNSLAPQEASLVGY